MVYGLSNNVQLWCNGQDVPVNIDTHNAAVINRSSMCNCILVDHDFHIKGPFCNTTSTKVVLSRINNPLTSLIIDNIKNMLNDSHDQPLSWSNSALDQFISNALSEKFPGNALLESSINDSPLEQFELETKEILENLKPRKVNEISYDNLDKLFVSKSWPLALSFTLSMLGTLGCFLSLWTAHKHATTSNLVTAGMLAGQFQPSFAAGSQVC